VKDLDEVKDSHLIHPFSSTKMTSFEVGVHGEKNIIVPSFGTTSALFTRHFQTLR
jgi:hypothetical protein